MTPQEFAPFAVAIAIGFTGLGMVIERWRTSPLRRIKQKYRAEKKSALRD